MSIALITGSTGLLGRQLTPKLLKLHNKVYLLTRSSSKVKKYFGSNKKIQILESDLTQKDFGLKKVQINKLRKQVSHIYHLAADYKPGLKKEESFQINYLATKKLIDWAKELKKLKLFFHVSTAFVAGSTKGLIREGFITKAPSFRNFYEEHKYQAENLFEKSKLPFIIIRPSLIIDHPKEIKGNNNGFYILLRAVKKGLGFYPGRSYGHVSVVPATWLIKTICEMLKDKSNIGKIINLSDPQPLTTKELINDVASYLGNKKPRFTLSNSLIKLIPFKSLQNKFEILNTPQIFVSEHYQAPSLREYLIKIIDNE